MSALAGSCALVGPDRSLDIIGKNDKIDSVNLTPRHYRAKENCHKAIELLPRQLLASLGALTPEEKHLLKWPDMISGYKPKQCESFSRRHEILNTFNDILAEKTRRVGIILPPVSASEPSIQLILDQIRKEVTREGYNPDQTIIVRRAGRSTEEALRAAALLTHMDRVSLLVGGLIQPHAEAIGRISDLAQIPALIVHANAPLGRTRQSLRVYPPIKKLATRLVDTLKTQDVKHAVVLYPQGANLELYHLMKSRYASGISYSEASYQPDDSQGILNATKSQISRLGTSQGNAAVLIFDNFRMVRHIANMVTTSLPGRKIIFAGNQQWRSPALVTPREESLQGSLFVDFIGSYTNLPDTIDAPVSDNNYFTTAQAASRIDYQIIGHRIGTLATEATRFGLPRHLIAGHILSVKNKWDYYFPNDELTFDAQRDSSWPVFLFKVEGDTIMEVR